MIRWILHILWNDAKCMFLFRKEKVYVGCINDFNHCDFEIYTDGFPSFWGVCVFEVWNKHNEPHRANHFCFKVMLWPSEAGRLTLPEGIWEEGHCWHRIYVFRNPRLRGQGVCENTVSRTSQGTLQLWCPIWASVNLCDLPSRVPFFPTPCKISKSTSVTNPQKMQSCLALSSACSSEIECN